MRCSALTTACIPPLHCTGTKRSDNLRNAVAHDDVASRVACSRPEVAVLLLLLLLLLQDVERQSQTDIESRRPGPTLPLSHNLTPQPHTHAHLAVTPMLKQRAAQE